MPFINIAESVARHWSEASGARDESDSQLVARLLAQVRAHAPTTQLLNMAAHALGGCLVLSEDGRADEVGGSPPKQEPHVVVSARSFDGASLTWSGTEGAPSASLMSALAQVVGVARHEQDVGEELHRERVVQLLTLVVDRLASPTALAEVMTAASIPEAGLVFSVWPVGASRVLTSSLAEGRLVVGETPLGTIAITPSSETVRLTAQRLEVACGLSMPLTVALIVVSQDCHRRAARE